MDEDFKYIPEASVSTVAPETNPDLNKRISVLILAGIVLTTFFYGRYIKAPTNFPVDSMIIVERGETLSGIANTLLEKNVIRSTFWFKAFLTVFGGTKGLVAGDYELVEKQNLIGISWKFARGQYDLKNVKITIPEGKTAKEIATILAKSFYNFNSKEFLRLASTSEGYLFPDTYLFLPNVNEKEVFRVLRETFDKKITTLGEQIKTFQKSGFDKVKKITLKDVVTMASILEEEGRTMETRQAIAGILWKRLSIGMGLQVDASIVYFTGKSDGSKLVQDDFKIDSPYNTYLYRGLTPTPISNPGLDAIRASVTPTKSNYLYYITDPNGGFHPAETYEKQLENEAKYLGH